MFIRKCLIFFRGGRDRPDRGRDRDRASVTREDGENISDRRGSRYPDSHQLFVGNLPHNVAEKELRTFFEGTILKYFILLFVHAPRLRGGDLDCLAPSFLVYEEISKSVGRIIIVYRQLVHVETMILTQSHGAFADAALVRKVEH